MGTLAARKYWMTSRVLSFGGGLIAASPGLAILYLWFYFWDNCTVGDVDEFEEHLFHC